MDKREPEIRSEFLEFVAESPCVSAKLVDDHLAITGSLAIKVIFKVMANHDKIVEHDGENCCIK